MGRGPRESIVDEQLPRSVLLLGVGIVVLLLLMVVTAVVGLDWG